MTTESRQLGGAAACRFCGELLSDTVVDLGMSPLCESYLRPDQLNALEAFYPLHVYVCRRCWLVQLEQYVSAEHIFSEYAYFSSFADSWVEHARNYTNTMIDRFRFGPHSEVIELASNDGYLLQWFVKAGVPSLGIEPAANVAAAAEAKGVSTLVRFFGVELAEELSGAGSLCRPPGRQQRARSVPDLNDFVAGMKIVLAPSGVVTMEFPHVMRLIDENQFDTIYHEHFCYFSLDATRTIFRHHGLDLFDVEEIPTHGGSLRVYARHADTRPSPSAVRSTSCSTGGSFGLIRIDPYRTFAAKVG